MDFSRTKTIWVAMRPWSFPASITPVVFGTTLAVQVGGAAFHPLFFVIALTGMISLQAAANIFNDVSDYERGLDREIFPVSGAVVRKLLSSKAALKLAAGFLSFGTLCGLYLAWQTTPAVLLIGLTGVFCAILYSLSAYSLKNLALGDFAVFLNFGVLGALGSWSVQSARPSWIPVLWSIPLGLLVIAILHANNWRDSAGDSGKGIKTVASLLGDKLSYYYYCMLLCLPYLLVAFFIFAALPPLPKMPFAFMIVFVSLPLAISLLKKPGRSGSAARGQALAGLDGETARLNLLFGALSVVAALIS